MTYRYPPAIASLSDKERNFISKIAEGADANAAGLAAGYAEFTGHALLRRPDIALAVRYEVMRLLATEGAALGFKTLRDVSRDVKAPAAARVAAGRALLASAGIAEGSDKKTGETKALNEMTREELDEAIRRYEKELDTIEGELAARAKPVNASLSAPVSPPGPKKLNDMLD